MKIRHATFLDVIGRPVKFRGLTIVPADVELEGSYLDTSFPLADISIEQLPPIVRLPVRRQYDVAWVRARLPSAFGVTPEPSEAEKTLLFVSFVAVPDGSNEGIAFDCTDHYGQTALYFSERETNQRAIEQAAKAFWEVLLSEPDELDDFEANVMHLGACITLQFGCADGEPYCNELSL